MNNPDPKLTTPTTPADSRRRIHPLVATAAGAVIVASLAATAAITGVFPKASSNAEQSAQSQTGQTSVMASQPVVDSTRAVAPATSAQYAQNSAPAQPQPTPAQQQQAQAPAAPPPPQYAQQPQYAQEAQPQPAACVSCGVVEGISATRQEGHGTGIGAVGGAVAGGVVGNQFGAGGGRTAMTLLGALGGGLAGNSVEKHLRSTAAYSVRVRMDNGKTRYFTYHEAPPFQQGQRVRIEHGTLAAA
ncbi:outer membrane lipoprotein SlyB [Paraburkholderia eburnea]|uniref:Outer membrane lipoprotein SlyB n=1 Tax=Paraburkholderia eburnea TaxID=1189126 RepID=A0A2S4MHA0_9BURK|nr:glycine zipper 2TM domain-containing protein [Paraburkholderia eburnea]POR53797.1 outer membrane lipoprotein SlyB [Paraburkholderia eburnea]PRZ25765.1 outer membrane lipoprotein SlyB [Paraburkholderia eburnea]